MGGRSCNGWRVDMGVVAMADLESLKRMYRRLALIEAAEPKALEDQKTYLEGLFVTRADKANKGGLQATSTSFEGGAITAVFKGSSDEERATALLNAIEEIEAEIAAEEAGSEVPLRVAAIMPRVICAPR